MQDFLETYFVKNMQDFFMPTFYKESRNEAYKIILLIFFYYIVINVLQANKCQLQK